MPTYPTAQTRNWIDAFIEANGRPPRMLHMGNVCNNAYQTAKMLNAAGADCDVYNADDYTIMASPEWDDAELTGDWGSLYFPLLNRVDLHGFERPRWFAQGPMALVIRYLTAKRRGQTAKANRLWRKMERARQQIADRENGIPPSLSDKIRAFAAALPRAAGSFLLKFFSYLGTVCAEAVTSPRLFLWRIRQKLGRLPEAEAQILDQHDEAARQKKREAMLQKIIDPAVLQRVYKDAETLFPHLEIQFDTQLESYMLHLKELRQLFQYYDVIQAYADQVVCPYLAGVEYIGYEHGTLRDYVYEKNDLSRLTLLGFARAKAIYLTNIDCYDSAVHITAKTGVPIICGLHGIDIQRIIHKINVAQPDEAFDGRFGVPKTIPLFYSPSRHTWLEEEGLFLKGDDKMVQAAARLAAEGFSFVLALSAWGEDIHRLKDIIAQYPHLESKVRWHKPLGKTEFYTVLRMADAVLDQFYLHVFGGITMEALSANGATLITCSIQPQLLGRFFSQPPPYLSADSQDDIYAAMKEVLQHPKTAKDLAEKGQDWVENHHNHRNIVDKCCEAYEILLPGGHVTKKGML